MLLKDLQRDNYRIKLLVVVLYFVISRLILIFLERDFVLNKYRDKNANSHACLPANTLADDPYTH